MAYDRPWKSYQDQLELLQSRGLVIGDNQQTLSYLERIGYYRLSAYWHPFREFKLIQDNVSKSLTTITTNEFSSQTHFIDAVNLYLFDKKFRLLVSDGIERIEVALRVDISHLLGKRSAFAHKEIEHFHPSFVKGQTFDRWLNKYNKLYGQSKEDFVQHYKNTHGGDLPIWVAVELWDFGAISNVFKMMKIQDQQKIALKYGISDFRVFANWLHCLNYLRNLSAHHSRLWNRNMNVQPKLPVIGEIEWCDQFAGKVDLIARPFVHLSIVRHLVKIICPNTQWEQRLKQHFLSFPEINSSKKRSISDIGVCENWKEWW